MEGVSLMIYEAATSMYVHKELYSLDPVAWNWESTRYHYRGLYKRFGNTQWYEINGIATYIRSGRNLISYIRVRKSSGS